MGDCEVGVPLVSREVRSSLSMRIMWGVKSQKKMCGRTLARESVDPPSLEVLKAGMDNVFWG